MTMDQDMKKAEALNYLKKSKIEDIARDIDVHEWLWKLYPELKEEVSEYKRLNDTYLDLHAQLCAIRGKWQWRIRPWFPLAGSQV
jgi:transposase-like protein